jgi:hypothetical protein
MAWWKKTEKPEDVEGREPEPGGVSEPEGAEPGHRGRGRLPMVDSRVRGGLGMRHWPRFDHFVRFATGRMRRRCWSS